MNWEDGEHYLNGYRDGAYEAATLARAAGYRDLASDGWFWMVMSIIVVGIHIIGWNGWVSGLGLALWAGCGIVSYLRVRRYKRLNTVTLKELDRWMADRPEAAAASAVIHSRAIGYREPTEGETE